MLCVGSPLAAQALWSIGFQRQLCDLAQARSAQHRATVVRIIHLSRLFGFAAPPLRNASYEASTCRRMTPCSSLTTPRSGQAGASQNRLRAVDAGEAGREEGCGLINSGLIAASAGEGVAQAAIFRNAVVTARAPRGRRAEIRRDIFDFAQHRRTEDCGRLVQISGRPAGIGLTFRPVGQRPRKDAGACRQQRNGPTSDIRLREAMHRRRALAVVPGSISGQSNAAGPDPEGACCAGFARPR